MAQPSLRFIENFHYFLSFHGYQSSHCDRATHSSDSLAVFFRYLFRISQEGKRPSPLFDYYGCAFLFLPGRSSVIVPSLPSGVFVPVCPRVTRGGPAGRSGTLPGARVLGVRARGRSRDCPRAVGVWTAGSAERDNGERVTGRVWWIHTGTWCSGLA